MSDRPRRMLRSAWAAAMVIAGVLLAGCGRDSSIQTLSVTGSSTVAPLVGEMAQAFERAQPGWQVDVQTGGSSRGLADARSGLADIGMISRGLNASETDFHGVVIGYDGIALVVHASNPLTNLTRQQVIDLFRGSVANWQALGGPDGKPVIVTKAEGRSTLELFLAHFGLESRQIAADVVIGDNQQGLKTVAANPMAVGYVSIGAARYEAEQGAPIRVLALDGVDARLEEVARGTYPLSRPLTLVTFGLPTAKAMPFLQFAQSAAAQPLVRGQFFVPVGADR